MKPTGTTKFVLRSEEDKRYYRENYEVKANTSVVVDIIENIIVDVIGKSFVAVERL